MPIDPAVLTLLEQIFPPGSPRIPELPLDVCRGLMDLFLPLAGPKAAIESIDDRTLSGIPVRIYRAAGAEIQPACVYFHGGGWALGKLDHYDTLCSQIASESRWTVISVDYRLAPEHKFPIPVFDCWAALQSVIATAAQLGIDARRVAVAGDSAGGNLAAVISSLARDYGVSLAGQILIYPVTDYVSARESYDFDYLLSRDDMIAFWNYYVHHPSEAQSPLASPLRAASFDGLPKTLILTAECDPLRDEGEEYGKKLREAGVDAVTRRYPGMIHGFVNMAGAIPQGREAMLQIAKQLKQLGTDESVLSARR
jgi:acetyl esterase